MRVNSYFSVNWIVGNAILPKHFWAPFVASNPPEVIQGDIAPGSLIGTGPYNYVQNIAGVSATMEANPTYYQPDEVGVIKEDPQSGIDFVATSPANQLTPVKIKDTGAGTGLNVIVKVQNLHAYSGVTFSETIVIQKIFPGPGAPTTLYNNGAVTLASKAINTQTFAQTLTKGLYAVTVTVQKSGGVAHSSTKYLWITVAGDINGDWIVDIFDIAPIALAFGSIRGGPGYNAIADINRDNIIDIFDIVQVALVFGWDP
jgi:ABC-type transport system substrate-binding protein